MERGFSMVYQIIGQYLINEGEKILHAPRKFEDYTGGNIPANIMLNDLEKQPHVFVIACLMDTQFIAEKAWLIPFELKRRIGNFNFSTLITLSQEEIVSFMSTPTFLHRYYKTKAKYLFEMIQKIEREYNGDVTQIWQGEPSSAEVVRRFAREFKIKFSDYRSIDISADRHVKRVLSRLGVVPIDPSEEQVIYAAREISPDFPGIIDLPLFNIGREYCHPNNPHCNNCPLGDYCLKKM